METTAKFRHDGKNYEVRTNFSEYTNYEDGDFATFGTEITAQDGSKLLAVINLQKSLGFPTNRGYVEIYKYEDDDEPIELPDATFSLKIPERNERAYNELRVLAENIDSAASFAKDKPCDYYELLGDAVKSVRELAFALCIAE